MPHRIRLIGAPLIAALFLALLATPGAAFASSNLALKLTVGGTGLVGGAPILASSTNVEMSNSFWSLACSQSSLTGKLAQNFKPKNDSVIVPEGSFAGGGNEGLCASSNEFVTTLAPKQTPEFTFDYSGQARLKYPRLRLVPKANIEKPESEQQACVVAANKIRGTFPVSESPQPLVVTFTAAKTHEEPNPGPECGIGKGAKPAFSGTFTFTSREAEVDVVLFRPH